jgi:NADPH-dependent curcumin reductase
MQNTQVILKSRPVGMAETHNFEWQSAEIPALQVGQFLVKNEYISIDPAIRGWMNAGTTYIPGIELGAVVRAFAVGEVIESKNSDFPAGVFVEGLLGAQAYAISNGQTGIHIVDAQAAPLSAYLGILGMPGMTAYFGLLDKGQPQAGETVLISGAGGIIGSLVGQIAKIKGCRVVGIAGGDKKRDFLLKIGFDAVIDYKNEDLHSRLQEICPEGVHIFFDNVGGQILDTALLHLARGARVVICGAISQYNDMTNIYGIKNYMKILTARGSLSGIIVFDYLTRYPEGKQALSQWLQNGQIQNQEHLIQGIEQFSQALKMLFTGENLGKLLIKI